MSDPSVVILLTVIATCCTVVGIWLIYMTLVFDRHLTSISVSLLDIKAELWNGSGEMEDATEDFLLASAPTFDFWDNELDAEYNGDDAQPIV